MSRQVLEFEPRAVFENFYNISKIPRSPGKQEQISNFICEYIKKLGIPVRQDKNLNVIATKLASPGYENCSPVMLQAHMDMVCEKLPESQHNFETDPLTLVVNGDKITADGTTLGADNGIGIAYMMALLSEKNILHPKIECIFTTDEETDMGGVLGLDFGQLASKLIINLDAPAVGVCGSGELEVEALIPKKTEPIQKGWKTFSLQVGGLTGGHSGQNAMAEKGNAIIYMARLIMAIKKRHAVQLASIYGGSGMSSAFARDAHCLIAIDPDAVASIVKIVADQEALFKSELRLRDPDIHVTFHDAVEEEISSAITEECLTTLLRLLIFLPDGVFSQNKDFPGNMESCSNVGSLQEQDGVFQILLLIRSVCQGKKYYLYSKTAEICESLGVKHHVNRDIPHWEYAVSEELKKLLEATYPEHPFSYSPGTLECGVFNQNIPNSCAITLGCPYYNAHSPSEYFLVSETLYFWHKLLNFLSELKKLPTSK